MTSIHMLGRSVVRLESVSLYGLSRNLSCHKEAHSGTGHAWRTNEPYIYANKKCLTNKFINKLAELKSSTIKKPSVQGQNLSFVNLKKSKTRSVIHTPGHVVM